MAAISCGRTIPGNTVRRSCIGTAQFGSIQHELDILNCRTAAGSVGANGYSAADGGVTGRGANRYSRDDGGGALQVVIIGCNLAYLIYILADGNGRPFSRGSKT